MKRGAVVAVAAGIIALLAGGAAWWLLSRPSGPDAAVQDFLAALADGDGDRAMAMIEGVPADAAAAALAGAGALIEDPGIDSIGGPDGQPTRAHVTFRLDGEEHAVSFGVVAADGDWRIAPDALGLVTPATTIGDAVRIGGVLVPAGAPASLLPASYAIEAAPAGILSGSAAVVVLPGADERLTLQASLSPAATALAQTQLDAYADACALPAAAVPDSCGLRVPWAADLGSLTSVAFRIEAHPVVVLAADDRSFAATGGAIVATATGTTRDGQSGAFTYRADDWALRGDMSFQGDELVLHVR